MARNGNLMPVFCIVIWGYDTPLGQISIKLQGNEHEEMRSLNIQTQQRSRSNGLRDAQQDALRAKAEIHPQEVYVPSKINDFKARKQEKTGDTVGCREQVDVSNMEQWVLGHLKASHAKQNIERNSNGVLIYEVMLHQTEKIAYYPARDLYDPARVASRNQRVRFQGCEAEEAQAGLWESLRGPHW
ncbi:hypothetical protein GLOTRDRAFT_97095 [Gloeophyllum trabeum ATCC 11539]|uniref:Uncharacterized protein n=1 Tax=Gloeophyllum trabeum (strain ATCC 11539 / FP-39264 / Madison 617) TaxID=670483 RepID=S7PR96_GLOTA|nr:uncharacterized protein GLOTRDRAFT_97095 [Gloeophyllum trabeum ATCC 11539]EPQ50376.1 hypothetical protein GLOTRDRAFT_97095 [Gloeophyllum trabeum ATCC 11539]